MFKNSLVCNTDVERAHVHYLGVRLVLIGLCSRFTHTASRQRLCGYISLLLLLHCFPFAFALSINFHSIRKHSLSLNHVANPSNCSNLSVLFNSLLSCLCIKLRFYLIEKAEWLRERGRGGEYNWNAQLKSELKIRWENATATENALAFRLVGLINKQQLDWVGDWRVREIGEWAWGMPDRELRCLFCLVRFLPFLLYFHCPELPSSPPAYLLQSIQFVE